MTDPAAEGSIPGRRPLIGRREVVGWITSCLFHGALLLGLGLLFLDGPQPSAPRSLLATLLDPKSGPQEELVWEAPRLAWTTTRVNAPQLPDALAARPVEVLRPEPVELPRETDSVAGTVVGPLGSLSERWFEPFGLARGGGLQGRSAAARARWVAQSGGTPESERAVERGLRWLAVHQCDDGSWNFDHWKSPCHGYCRNPGTAATTTGATGVVLMAFLGAGYTHREGPHQQVVRRGLYYLTRRAVLTPDGADLQEGTMYGQGLATIAVCEAYAMTRDPQLRQLAQEAVRFIDRAQDKRGGWRYRPGQPGDTTVTGWQLMALKSAQLAGLQVPSPTLLLVERFLDSVQSDRGAQYGYLTTEPRRSTTAIGLLCRMYTGWPREHPGLRRGVALLARWGPSDDDLYYDYYATQVMRHWGGSDWERWNRKMRDHLIATQATRGHEAGSWYFSGNRIESGGRVLNTALAVMILEVYYRYLPLYQQKAFQKEQH